MTESPNLALPLVQPSQAQKHVTVNEAFVRLDAVSQLCLTSRTLVDPPAAADDGAAYAVPIGATGAWSGLDGVVAVWSNGGWIYLVPKVGWRAKILDEDIRVSWTGAAWEAEPLSLSLNGAGSAMRTVEGDYTLVAGGVQTLGAVIPSHAMVLAVSARVVGELTGALSTWKMGTAAADNQFGSGMGTSVGSYASGILGAPTTFYGATPVQFSPTGGTVDGGTIRIAMTYLEFTPPNL